MSLLMPLFVWIWRGGFTALHSLKIILMQNTESSIFQKSGFVLYTHTHARAHTHTTKSILFKMWTINQHKCTTARSKLYRKKTICKPPESLTLTWTCLDFLLHPKYKTQTQQPAYAFCKIMSCCSYNRWPTSLHACVLKIFTCRLTAAPCPVWWQFVLTESWCKL